MSKIEKTFWWICFILIIYSTIGFKLIPDIIQEQLVKNLDENLTQKTTIEKVEFNPFTLNTKIYDFKLADEKQTTLSIEMLNADIAFLRSIFELHVSIEEVVLKKLFVNVIQEKDDSINLTKLLKPSKNKTEEKKAESTNDIKFLVSKILLQNSNIDFTKKTDDKPYKLAIKDLNYSLYDLGTYKDSLSSNDLNLKINENTNINIVGAFKLQPFTMYGKAKVSDLRIKELLDYKKELFNFELNKKANVNLNLDYNIDLKDSTDIKLSSTLFDLNNINLNLNKVNAIKLDKLDIASFKFDLVNQKISLSNSNINKLDVNMIQDKDGLNLANLMKSSTTKENDKKDDSKPWIISINDTKQNNNSFVFNDKNNSLLVESKNFSSKIANVDINGSKITLDKLLLSNPKISFSDNKNALFINTKNTNIKLTSLNLKDNLIGIKNINVKDENIDLKDTNSKLNIDINKTNLDLNKVNINGSEIDISSITLDNSNINLINSINNISLKTKDLKVLINSLSQKNSALNMNSIRIIEPSLEFLNTKDKTKILANNLDLNITAFSNSKAGLKISKALLNKPIISVILAKKESTSLNEKAPVKSERAQQKEASSKLDIGPINISNATMNFEDKNLPIAFKTTITELNGKISEFKNTTSSSTKLEVNGIVDKYGTTKITGIVNPSSIKILTDINMIFKNIAMENFTPYTGKFIGRKLDSGKLDLNLKYNIQKSNLDAKNNVIINKIKLGDKVESPDAVSLPLELAIALLEDSSGVIDLNLPVSGNIDDPQFSVAPIVWKAFVNLITKALTAPFSLLGAIFGFDENEIKSVSFDFGKSSITPIQKETLDKISKILTKRPSLGLKLVASYDEEKDLNALKRDAFEQIVNKKIPNKDNKDYEGKYLNLLENLYETNGGKIKSLKKSHTKDGKLNIKKYINDLEKYIVSKQKIQKIDLETMAKNRIVNIQKYLVEEKKINKKQVILSKEIDIKTLSKKTSIIDLKIDNVK